MGRISSFVRVCVLAVVASLLWRGAIPRAADNNAAPVTPRQVWEVYQRAITGGRFGQAFDCLTPGAQEEHLERCVLGGLMLAGESGYARDLPKEIEPLIERLRAMMRSYGIDPKQVSDEFEAAHKKAEDADVGLSEERTREIVLGHLKGDRRKFFEESMRVMSEFERLIAKNRQRSPAAAESHDAGGTDAAPSGPESQVLGVKEHGDRAVMALKRRLSENQLLMHGSLRIRYITETRYFRRIDGRWFLASETNEPVEAPLYVVKEASLPYSREIKMDFGDAIRFELPNGKEVAIWRTGGISWGEKPFRRSPVKYRKNPDGGRTVEGDDSYIRMGGVKTVSNLPGWSQRDLYVGKYRILLEESAGKEGTSSLKVQIRVATPSEGLHGDAAVEYFVKQLKSASLGEQKEAVEKLGEMASLGAFDAHFAGKGEANKIADAIRPLLKHSDAAVSKAAINAMVSLGDEEGLLAVITPGPRVENRSVDGGWFFADWYRKQEPESVKRRVATFFDSEDEALVRFAVGFFAAVPDPVVEKHMLAALDHQSAEIRAGAVRSVRSYFKDPAEAARVVIAKLDDKDEQVVAEALNAADHLLDHIKARTLTRLLKHPSARVREAVCYPLARCQDPDAVAPLLEATRDKEPRVRGQAAATLGQLGTAAAFDRLIEMLQDPVAAVREGAINGLRGLRVQKAAPALKRLLETEKDRSVRRMAEETLRQM